MLQPARGLNGATGPENTEARGSQSSSEGPTLEQGFIGNW